MICHAGQKRKKEENVNNIKAEAHTGEQLGRKLMELINMRDGAVAFDTNFITLRIVI